MNNQPELKSFLDSYPTLPLLTVIPVIPVIPVTWQQGCYQTCKHAFQSRSTCWDVWCNKYPKVVKHVNFWHQYGSNTAGTKSSTMWYRILHRSLKWVIESNGLWNYSYILCVYMCTINKPLYEERSGERDRWYRPVFNLQPTTHNLPLKIIWSWLLWVTRAPTEQIQVLAWY
jgi:hypothetical protein